MKESHQKMEGQEQLKVKGGSEADGSVDFGPSPGESLF